MRALPVREPGFERLGAFFREAHRAAARVRAAGCDFDERRAFERVQIARQGRLVEPGALA